MKNSLFATIIATSAIVATPALALNEIKSIEINGIERVERETVMSYLPLQLGDEYSPRAASEMVKVLYGTGLFDNVAVDWKDGKLLIDVKENPMVNRVVFEGNDEFDKDRLLEMVTLKPRTVYTPGKVQEDVREIQAAYRNSGFFLAKITPQLIRRDQNRVDLIFKIEEGEATKVNRIRFVGNRQFGDAELRNIVNTRESRWWRFLTSSDNYDPDRIEFDKELLRRFYISKGFADVQVNSAVAELTRDKQGFFITYTVNEGAEYTFGKITASINQEEFEVKPEELMSVVAIKEGTTYDGTAIEKDIDHIVDLMGTRGFAFINVVPQPIKDEKKRTIGLNFSVQPGPRVYVNRIDVKGNSRTRDNVIRREMRLAEGDAFATNKLERSEDRLNRLEYFSEVQVVRKESDQPDRMDLEVNVKEQSTGEFNVGAGFSSFEGALATASIRERNFLGKGQDVQLAFAVSQERQDYNISFTEPYFMGEELSAGIDLYNRRREYQDQSSYDKYDVGGALRLGVPLNEFMSNTISFGYESTNIENIDAAASVFVRNLEGDRDSLKLTNTIGIDTRDSFLTPSKGYNLSLATTYSGFGSKVEYLRNVLSGAYHMPLAEDWVLSLGGRAGYLYDINDETPLYENFQSGGNNLRGFARSGIGPRDSTTGDALGGDLMLGTNVELRFPFPGLKDTGVSGLFFMDGGIVSKFDDQPQNVVANDEVYRVSIGTGIFWRSPLGPLRIDFGIPIVKADNDETEVFSFSLGTRF